LDSTGVIPLGNYDNSVEVLYGSDTLIGGPAAGEASVTLGN
jgi:hypothetical protein